MSLDLSYMIAKDRGSSFLSRIGATFSYQAKRWCILATAALSCLNLLGQGTVHFGGDNSTPIINGLTRSPVAASDGIKAALYWSPIGTTNFRPLGAPVNVGIPLPGVFVGGARSTDPATPGGEKAQFQVRAWEAAYGASHEEAASAPAQGGRGALIGKSSILVMPTGNATPPTPPTLLTAYGLESFVMQPVQLPPSIVCPPDFSTNQPIVNYSPPVPGDVVDVVFCMPPSGSTLPVGTNVIVCTASSASGTNQCSFRVTVTDTEPPLINCPTGIKIEFRDASGAHVTFAPTAIDSQEGVVLVTCLPVSGAIFPIGTTAVVCAAADASGNSSSCRFSVTVLGARGIIEDVLADLAVAGQGSDPREKRWLKRAMGRLSLSLAPALWVDQIHLATKHDKQVFLNLGLAIQDLREIIRHERGSVQLPVWQSLIARLTKAERLLASVQIEDRPKHAQKVEKSS